MGHCHHFISHPQNPHHQQQKKKQDSTSPPFSSYHPLMGQNFKTEPATLCPDSLGLRNSLQQASGLPALPDTHYQVCRHCQIQLLRPHPIPGCNSRLSYPPPPSPPDTLSLGFRDTVLFLPAGGPPPPGCPFSQCPHRGGPRGSTWGLLHFLPGFPLPQAA